MAINIVLFEPEIPQNTGNIIRTAAAFGCRLHTIRPYGFFLDDKRVGRSATNHLNIELIEYDDWEEFVTKNDVQKGNIFFFTKRGKNLPGDIDYTKFNDVYLMFGKESTGIPREILRAYPDQCIRIPMDEKMISMNISNTVAIGTYEVLRQTGFPNLIADGGIQWED